MDNVAGSPPPGLGGVDPTISISSVRITRWQMGPRSSLFRPSILLRVWRECVALRGPLAIESDRSITTPPRANARNALTLDSLELAR